MKKTISKVGDRSVMSQLTNSCHFEIINSVDYFVGVPDEIIFIIGEALSGDQRSLRALRQVNSRFRRIGFLLITKIDSRFIHNEPSLGMDNRTLDFILRCSNLKHLSLIVSYSHDVKKLSDPLLLSLMKNAADAKKVASLLVSNCPNIHCIEVAGIHALRMTREYCRKLSMKGCCNIEELRVYAVEDFNALYRIMRPINQFCPKLNTFKLLQRDQVNRPKPVIVPFDKLWAEMSTKLTKFSTNIISDEIVNSAISKLSNLERIVVWGLEAEAVHLLSHHLVNLRILILMSVNLTGIYAISRLEDLTELHIKVQPGFMTPTGAEASALQLDFKLLFRKIGQKLKKLSFNFRNQSTSTVLDSIPDFCTSLSELRFSDCTNSDALFKMAERIDKLERFVWNGDHKYRAGASVPRVIQSLCNNLAREKPSIKQVVAYNIIYIPLTCATGPEMREK